jgi:hypothetical protein
MVGDGKKGVSCLGEWKTCGAIVGKAKYSHWKVLSASRFSLYINKKVNVVKCFASK